MARIIFLGTAGSTAVVSKQLRASGGIIIQVEDLQFHLDPGPGALVKAKEYGVNLHHNTAILISHNHINHCNDLNAVIDAMTHGGIEHRGLVLGSQSVLGSIESNNQVLTKYHRELVEKIIVMDKKHKVGIELVEINALPAEHTDPTAIGFKFFCPKFTLSYTGDTILTPELLEGLTGSDILILNVPNKKSQGMNLDPESAIKIISHVRPRLAIITHFGLEMLKFDPIIEAREIQRITGVQTIAAKDGMVISPGYGEFQSPIKGY
ncbi:MAG TPA: MBL fold metallo-hydrolase [Candidatus Nanoarchaeia archaeon]|nr:MBL fold metallo-hydrolase [Candidatus Nanoarchaeia archaeon]